MTDKWGMQEKYWEDFAIGNKMRTGEVTVTEAHVVNWGCLTGDWYPLHFNAEYAKTTSFGTRVAHGPLILSLAVGLVAMSGFYGNSILAWIGAENVRVMVPVRIGDTVHVEIEIVNKKEIRKSDRSITIIRYTIKNQRSEDVATMDFIMMMHRRKDS